MTLTWRNRFHFRESFLLTENLSQKFGTQINSMWDDFGSDFTYPGNLPAYIEEYFEDQENAKVAGTETPPGKIACLPLPGEVLVASH
jgi:leucine-rich repeat-containing G protein-coupled receptor 6